MSSRPKEIGKEIGKALVLGTVLYSTWKLGSYVWRHHEDAIRKLWPSILRLKALNDSYVPPKKGFQESEYLPPNHRSAAVGPWFSKLSPRLAYNCFTYCNVEDLSNVAAVCRSWREFLQPLLRDRDYLKGCAYRGFSTKAIRHHWWKKLALADVKISDAHEAAFQAKARQVSRVQDQIERDIHRTLGGRADVFENEEAAVRDLMAVLVALSNVDEEVGYCQGMNFVVALLLSVMSSSEAFYTMQACMNSPRLRIRHLYLVNLPDLQVHFFQHMALRATYLPQLHAHLVQHHVGCELYLTEWFMTLFSHGSIPLATTTRLWDIFLVDGWKFFHRVALALLALSQDALLQADFDQILNILKAFQDPNVLTANLIIHKTKQYKVTNRILHSLRAEFLRG